MFGFRDISRNPFRSTVVVLCALLVAGFSLAAVLIVRGAGESLELAETRFGADIIVVPDGAERQARGALLMATPMNVWMPSTTVDEVRAIAGIGSASPQLYLSTLRGPREEQLQGMDAQGAQPYFPSDSMFLVAYDPSSDFALGPWLPEGTTNSLSPSQSFAGADLSMPEDAESISVLGLDLTLKARLRAAGTSLDESLFISLDTAERILATDVLENAQGFAVPEDSISSILIKVSPDADPEAVAALIGDAIPGVVPLTSPDLFALFRSQMRAQRTGMLAILGVILALSLAVVALVFSMVTNQRRREIGVLRALGSSRARVLCSVLSSAALLALIGGVTGVALAGVAVFLFRQILSDVFGFPFSFPSTFSLLVLIVVGLSIALAAVLVAAFIPAYRVGRQDPALSMRE